MVQLDGLGQEQVTRGILAMERAVKAYSDGNVFAAGIAAGYAFFDPGKDVSLGEHAGQGGHLHVQEETQDEALECVSYALQSEFDETYCINKTVGGIFYELGNLGNRHHSGKVR